MKQMIPMALCAMAAAVMAEKPNVVIIYGDDVGFGDIGVYGATQIPTPNIDRFAAESLRFTDAHCSAATCTPSRFSMLTGVHAFRHGVRVLPPNAPLTISTNRLTLPKLFQQAGYTTGVIGKWHLGLGTAKKPSDWNGEVKPGPLEIGFDVSFLIPSTNDRVPCVYLKGHRVLNLDPADPLFVGNPQEMTRHTDSTQYPDGKTNREAMTYYPSSHGHDNSVINGIGRMGYMAGGKAALWDDEGIADVFVEQAKAYITENRDHPFFLYFASQDIHVPRAPHPRFQGKSELGYRGDAMVQFDWTTGEILQTLETLGLTENTLVIVSSDNGPVYDDGYEDGTTVLCSNGEEDRGHDGSGPWRGGKYQIFEGGTRVPFIIRWPGHIQPGVTPATVNQIDLIASFAELLDIDLPEEEAVDSRDMLAAFLGNDSKGLTSMIEESFGLALRKNQWKYVQAVQPKWGPGRPPIERALYNLAEDPGEATNRIVEFPERAEQMAQQLDRYKKEGRVRPRREGGRHSND